MMILEAIFSSITLHVIVTEKLSGLSSWGWMLSALDHVEPELYLKHD